MWKVLGVETIILINADAVWTKRLLELSRRRKDAPKFQELLAKANIRYFFDTIREVHMFLIFSSPPMLMPRRSGVHERVHPQIA